MVNEDKLIRQLSRGKVKNNTSPRARVNHADLLSNVVPKVEFSGEPGRFDMPNKSGDHFRSFKTDDPVNDYDLVNKKYVDDNAGAIPLTTKGDLVAYDTAATRLPVGDDDLVLTADSSEATGLKWAAGGGVVDTPIFDETNRIIYLVASFNVYSDTVGAPIGLNYTTGDLKNSNLIFRVPSVFNGKKLKASVIWFSMDTDTNNVYWRIGFYGGGVGESRVAISETSGATCIDTESGTADLVLESPTYTTTATVTTNQFLRVKLERLGNDASDTSSKSAYVLGVKIEAIDP